MGNRVFFFFWHEVEADLTAFKFKAKNVFTVLSASPNYPPKKFWDSSECAPSGGSNFRKAPRRPVHSCCCLLQCTRVSFSTSSGISLIGKKSDWSGSDHCNSHRDLTCDCIWSSASIRASGGRMRLYIPPRCDEGFLFFFHSPN